MNLFIFRTMKINLRNDENAKWKRTREEEMMNRKHVAAHRRRHLGRIFHFNVSPLKCSSQSAFKWMCNNGRRVSRDEMMTNETKKVNIRTTRATTATSTMMMRMDFISRHFLVDTFANPVFCISFMDFFPLFFSDRLVARSFVRSLKIFKSFFCSVESVSSVYRFVDCTDGDAHFKESTLNWMLELKHTTTSVDFYVSSVLFWLWVRRQQQQQQFAHTNEAETDCKPARDRIRFGPLFTSFLFRLIWITESTAL